MWLKILVKTRETENCLSKNTKKKKKDQQMGKFKFMQLRLKATLGWGDLGSLD